MIPLLVLAGGKATRLKHLSANTAKYLQPITDQKRFADFHLNWVKKSGFQKVILSVGHLANQVIEYCGDGSAFGLEISYIEDGDSPCGTGGATVLALKETFSHLAITYGDTLLEFDCPGFIAQYLESGLQGGMTLLRNPQGHPCNARLDGNLAVYDKFAENVPFDCVDYGFLMLKRSAIEAFTSQRPLDLATPLADLSRQKQLFGFEVHRPFMEIGTPETLQKFRAQFSGDIAN